MRILGLSALALVVSALCVRAEDPPPPADAGGAGWLRVCVADVGGKPVDATGWTVTAALTPKGGKERTIEMKVVPASAGGACADPRGCAAPSGKAGDLGNGQTVMIWVDAGADAGCASFEAPVSLASWACPMKDSDPADKPGKCSKCGMDLQSAPLEFTAQIVFHTPGGDVKPEVFAWPDLPATAEAAAARIEALSAELTTATQTGKYADMRRATGNLEILLSKVADLAPKESHDAVASNAVQAASQAKDLRVGLEKMDKAGCMRAYGLVQPLLMSIVNDLRGKGGK